MTTIRRAARVAAFLLSLAAASRAGADGPRIGLAAGVGSAYGQTYYALGGRLGYDVAFGLTPEVGLMFWDGANPSFVQLSPGLTWYVPIPFVRPYLGGFYAHDFVAGGQPDQDSVGFRGGIGVLGAGPVSVNVGFAYARRLSCAGSCDTWWPEASAGFAF
jgi:hypothetical protein